MTCLDQDAPGPPLVLNPPSALLLLLTLLLLGGSMPACHAADSMATAMGPAPTSHPTDAYVGDQSAATSSSPRPNNPGPMLFSKAQYMKQHANMHFDATGVKMPNATFLKAVRQASFEFIPSDPPGQPPRKLVIMALANEAGMQQLVPMYLDSMSRIMHPGTPGGQERRLSSHVVIATSSLEANDLCEAARKDYGHVCVWDTEAVMGTEAMKFHSTGFYLIGFARIKYILNIISAGLDVLSMDTDILVFKNPVPLVYHGGGEVVTLVEKCMVVDPRADYSQISNWPGWNIGVLFVRSTPGAVRCVYNWLFEMWQAVETRSKVWDQDVFAKVMKRCTSLYNVSLNALPPPQFHSGCYKDCGCNYEDSAVQLHANTPWPGTSLPSGHQACPRDVVRRWCLVHLPCSGAGHKKRLRMERYAAMHRDAMNHALAA